MNQTDKLIEQHVREYEMRLRHIDEMTGRAMRNGATPEKHSELAEILEQRDKLAGELGSLKSNQDQREAEDILRYGPMGIWDILAQKAEHLVEKLEKK